jgi:peptidoglycan/xylan/chitin deacetylase (PgdA/CDA1 family)
VAVATAVVAVVAVAAVAVVEATAAAVADDRAAVAAVVEEAAADAPHRVVPIAKRSRPTTSAAATWAAAATTTSRSDPRAVRSSKPFTALAFGAFACAIHLAFVGAPRADVPPYRVKPVDGNRYGLARFRSGGMIRGECARRPCIALTFDDGPEFANTPRILDELDRHGVRATFFVTGHRMDGDGDVAERNRETLRDTFRRGHLVGNHTYHHDVMDTMSEATLNTEIDRTATLIREVIGQPTYLFRAPYGALHEQRAVHAVYSRGLTPVFWGIDSRDWAVHTPEEVLANVQAGLDATPRGGVILFHDTLPRTADALPLVFAEIERRNEARRARGELAYEFVGLEELWEPIASRRGR